MVRLYLLGFTHDLKGVVFSQRRGGKTGTFWVPIDDAFMGAVGKLEQARRDRDRSSGSDGRPGRAKDLVGLKDLPTRSRALPPVGRSEPRTGLPASEIQQMLRQGKSIKTVVAAAKTEVAWVERLAEPVLTERIGVVRLAQRAYMLRPRLGTAGLQLGEAVRRNLEERRATTDTIEGLDDAWDAKATASGKWRVWVRFSHRGKRRSAEWEFRKSSRQIVPRNRLATELGWWAPDAPPPAPAPETGEEESDEGAEGKQQPPKRRARPKSRRGAAGKRKAKSSRTPSRSRAPARKKPSRRRTPGSGSRRPASRRRR
jgi:DUF3071 family protein